jgi:hypothetical protein
MSKDARIEYLITMDASRESARQRALERLNPILKKWVNPRRLITSYELSTVV